MPDEWARLYSRPDVYDLEFLQAKFVRHRYARHVHEFYVFGIIESGLQTFSYRRDKHRTAPGGVIILNPDEPHTGEPAAQGGFIWKAIYPSPELMRDAASQITGRSQPLPFFSDPVVYDPELATQLLRLHQALLAPESSLPSETHLLAFLTTLITRYADARISAAEPQPNRAAIRRVRDYLEAHYADDLSLNQLARVAALSPYHLSRLFCDQFGIPPHAYLESIRIRHARRLLASGVPIVEVALETGFADQSHFTQRFKRMVGVPPGQYVKDRNFTQDAHP